jgi:hypothetical protein
MIKILHEGYGFSNKSNTTYPTLMWVELPIGMLSSMMFT